MLLLHPPAKINWFLRILGKRGDGYHEIQSLTQCVSLYDTIMIEEADSLEVITDAPIPLDENLVLKAASLLREAAKTAKGARITLRKEIPLAAGLGGGSSDAAFTLKGLCELWDIELPPERLAGLAATLGSDIPFFLGSPSAFIEGRGEKVTPLALKRSLPLLLAKPPIGVSAGWAYSEAEEHSGSGADMEKFIQALEAGELSSLAPMMKNDLEAPVMRRHPEVAELKDRLMENNAIVSLMSGSGPTVFGLFRSREMAERASRSLSGCWRSVVETLP